MLCLSQYEHDVYPDSRKTAVFFSHSGPPSDCDTLSYQMKEAQEASALDAS